MINKPLYVIIAVYFINISFLGIDQMGPATMGFELTNLEGEPLRPTLIEITPVSNLNEAYEGIVTPADINPILQFNSWVATIVNVLIPALSGTYIFLILAEFGVPEIFLIGIGAVWVFMLARFILGAVRGF